MMIINDLLEEKKISKYKLAREICVPYSTINDLCNKKTSLRKCSAENVYKIAKYFNVTVEWLIEKNDEHRISFDLFKSNVCHKLKELGDKEFVLDLLKSNEIRDYYEKSWYPEALYLLAMLDYLSRINEYPQCSDYNDIRSRKLDTIIYPASVLVAAKAIKNRDIKKEAFENSIPEFRQFNIVESEVRNVV